MCWLYARNAVFFSITGFVLWFIIALRFILKLFDERDKRMLSIPLLSCNCCLFISLWWCFTHNFQSLLKFRCFTGWNLWSNNFYFPKTYIFGWAGILLISFLYCGWVLVASVIGCMGIITFVFNECICLPGVNFLESLSLVITIEHWPWQYLSCLMLFLWFKGPFKCMSF